MGPIKIYCLTLVVQRWTQRLCSTTKGTRERRWRDVLGRHSKPRGGWGAFYPSDSNRHSLIFPFNISTTLSWGICQDNVRNAAMFLNQLPYYWKPGDLSAKDLQLQLKRCSNDLFLTRRCYLCAAHISFSPESSYLKYFFLAWLSQVHQTPCCHLHCYLNSQCDPHSKFTRTMPRAIFHPGVESDIFGPPWDVPSPDCKYFDRPQTAS